jgi:hypothetical protein
MEKWTTAQGHYPNKVMWWCRHAKHRLRYFSTIGDKNGRTTGRCKTIIIKLYMAYERTEGLPRQNNRVKKDERKDRSAQQCILSTHYAGLWTAE